MSISLSGHSATTDQTSPLCSRCGDLFSSEGLHRLHEDGRWRHSRLLTFPARSTCRFCQYVWARDFIEEPPWKQNKHPVKCLRDYVYTSSGSPRKIPGNLTADAMWVAIRISKLKDLPEHLFIAIESESGRLLWQTDRPLVMIAPKESPCAGLTRYRPLAWDGPTPAAVASLKQLIETCQTSHPRCQPSGPRPLPTRVLKLQPDTGGDPNHAHVRLVCTDAGQLGHYVALSYCWGGPQLVQLTHASQDGFERHIDSDTLPQTLQDAITITRALGFEYLWVDALCILQDDKDDKKREIANMCAIYENSTVTIAAGTARAVAEGFLYSSVFFNSPAGKKSLSCTIPVALDGTASSNPEAFITLQPQQWASSADLPLNSRGWTYQEALLPPRLLVFSDIEPVLRCRTHDKASMGNSFVWWQTLQPRRLMNFVKGGQHEMMEYGIEGIWRYVVEEFSKRDLGFAEDRPHAISGVVDFLATMFDDECHFGVWRSCLLPCLLWKISPGRASDTIPNLPTWSWMSVTGEADLDPLQWLGKPQATIEWDDTDASHRRLVLTCRVLTSEEGRSQAQEVWPDLLVAAGEEETPEDQSLQGEVYLILGRESSSNRTLALVATVMTDEGSPVYRRCGLAELGTQATWMMKPQTRLVLE